MRQLLDRRGRIFETCTASRPSQPWFSWMEQALCYAAMGTTGYRRTPQNAVFLGRSIQAPHASDRLALTCWKNRGQWRQEATPLSQGHRVDHRLLLRSCRVLPGIPSTQKRPLVPLGAKNRAAAIGCRPRPTGSPQVDMGRLVGSSVGRHLGAPPELCASPVRL